MKKEPARIESGGKDKTYRSDLRKARWCELAGEGSVVAAIVAAGILSHTSKLEQSSLMLRIDTDALAGGVAVLGWAIGKNRSNERADEAMKRYYSDAGDQTGNS
jgi:hypothetical protein